MKTCKYFAAILMALALPLAMMAQAPEDGQRGPGGGPGGRPGGFQPKLEGVWQLCNLTADEQGQPQLSFLPMLKVFSNGEQYQNVGIPTEGGCFITSQGGMEITSDSTYNEMSFRMHRNDSTEAGPTVVKYRFRGPMWLTLTYTEAGKAEPTTELWMRVRQQRGEGQRGMGVGPQMQRGEGQQGQQGMRGQRGQGQRGMRGGQRGNIQQNPFEDSGSTGSISDADD